MGERKTRKRTEPAEPVCSVGGCDAAVFARGLCEPHWEDLARSRGPFAPERPVRVPPDTASPLKSWPDGNRP